MEKIILSQIPIEELKSILLSDLIIELQKLKSIDKEKAKLLTRKQTKEYLQISFVTLNEWTKEGKIKAFRVGTRVRYKEEDLLNALKEIKTDNY